MTDSTPTQTTTPADTLARFTACINAGDLDGALDLYDREAVFEPAPGEASARGPEEIRAALASMLALRPKITGELQKVHETGDTALVINRWRLSGTNPGGQPVQMGGTSADVMRRRDGAWKILVDDPWGGGSLQ